MEWILVLVILVQLCLLIKRVWVVIGTLTPPRPLQKEQIMAAVLADLERITPKQKEEVRLLMARAKAH